jgi:hypothetical protein
MRQIGKAKIWLRRRFNTSFDNRLENFILSLLEIEGLKDVLRDFSRGKLMWFQIRTIIELAKFKHTLTDVYIPHAIKVAKSTEKEIARSKYRHYLKSVDLESNVQEIIRLGYVNLFHKLESYRDELVSLVNEQLKEREGIETDIKEYLKETFKFKIADLKRYPETINRINWISNCVKHYGGYPKKNDPPLVYKDLDQSKKIHLLIDDLTEDIDFVIQFTARLFKTAILGAITLKFGRLFDNSDQEGQDKLGPTAALLSTLAVVFFHSLKDEKDDEFIGKWESFVTHYSKKGN